VVSTFYKGLMSFYLQDEQGQVVNVPLYVLIEDTQTSTDMVTEGAAVALLINNLTGCQVISGLFGVYLPTGGSLRPSPAIGSLAIKGATIKFQTTAEDREYAIVIPSILDSKLSGVRLNTGDTDVAAFINHMVQVGEPYVYTDEGGLALDTFVSSFLNVRKPAAHFRRRITPA
jgi:hypothetical protein